jgi:hypothetical protein
LTGTRKLTEAIRAVADKALSDAMSDSAIEGALKSFIREFIQEEAQRRSPWLVDAVNEVIKPGNVT